MDCAAGGTWGAVRCRKREKIGREGFSTIVSRRVPREDPGTKRTEHSLISTYVLGGM
jgi:hypothetical protein